MTIPPSFIIGGIIFIVCTFLLIGFLLYLRHKYPKKSRLDPVMNSIFLSMFIISILILCELVGVLPPDWNKEHWYIHLGIILFFMGYNLWISIRLRAMPFDKQLDIAWSQIWENYREEPNRGNKFGVPLILYKLIERPSHTTIPNALGTFLLFTNSFKTILFQLNVYTGAVVHLKPDPSVAIINELVGKPAASEFSAFLQDFKHYSDAEKGDENEEVAT